MSNLIEQVRSQFLAPSLAFEPVTKEQEPWQFANNFAGVRKRQGSKALLRSESLYESFAGLVLTVSLMEGEDGEFLTSSIHRLLPKGSKEDPAFQAVGFLSLNSDESYQKTGVFAGGKLMADSPIAALGYTRIQLRVVDSVMEMIAY